MQKDGMPIHCPKLGLLVLKNGEQEIQVVIAESGIHGHELGERQQAGCSQAGVLLHQLPVRRPEQWKNDKTRILSVLWMQHMFQKATQEVCKSPPVLLKGHTLSHARSPGWYENLVWARIL